VLLFAVLTKIERGRQISVKIPTKIPRKSVFWEPSYSMRYDETFFAVF